ncbi:hypothetical protein QCD85_03920 [Paenibacillus sp. PsM32]|uniref:Uncharacterized protein n=1 Tax=Paenibacillus kyungheensis TaxID=1452732 RepID=A0AAX3M612_9BACL|nr:MULTISPECIES: hypothetical protein [Paenibacillus]MDQ1232927.1 uncharacterized protein HemY [Paenibacillus sp. SORGH_AS_0306]MDN4617226.1 hypothetical protein [Paenibacillus sp. PsM32]MDR6109973.1 uncharacterized protein HemY [Paenibacillus sp. SORGH_AS_0338]WCT56954.1 hypothetical protein PQ456_05365 [Paenibacillus kyungheensis]WDF49954.1 hypothetical protein PQ460_18465 [Paenibacillus sp. KACC 21273]
MRPTDHYDPDQRNNNTPNHKLHYINTKPAMVREKIHLLLAASILVALVVILLEWT